RRHTRSKRDWSSDVCSSDLTATGVHTLIGKVYDTDVVGIFQAMERIAQAGFVPAAEFSIPEPIAYLAPLYFLLQEKVEGRLAKRSEERRVGKEGRQRWGGEE